MIVTDHRSLRYIFYSHSSLSKGTLNMLQRWALQLSIYDYDIEFARGSQILQADFLSRQSKLESGETTTFLIQPLPIDKHTLAVQTKKCYGAILHALKHGWSLNTKQ